MINDRRDFIKKISLAAGMINLPGLAGYCYGFIASISKE